MSLSDLSSYTISPERGFLCAHDAARVVLEGVLGEGRDIALRLPEILPTGKVREVLRDRLPQFAPEDAMTLGEAEATMAMVHYSFLVQSYIWGAAEPVSSLPETLAVPIVALADRLGQQPLLQYSGYVLDNWGMMDSARPIALDNIFMIQKFAGGTDEAWFVLIHVAIEAKAGEVLALFGQLIEAAAASDANQARNLLEQMATIWAEINAIFDRMPEQCDPYIYFRRVRPYIHGWKDNPALKDGLVYEGVARFGGAPQVFRGQTGSQSSIVPSMDALLGVGHAADPLRAYLDELHIYRPPAHRRFIDDVRTQSTLRDFVSQDRSKGLVDAYNATIQSVADFRSRHLEYAASYIHKQGGRSAGNDTEVGTGGTPFMKYLKKHRDETAAMLLTA
ncbi:indoleamine 2,3-dioxygenase [Sphingorhabdus contaminans]|uniref:Indoleamine 2,3-dioxygenase n=1 Tax=Sphingorhabdus contaminans TaxID=1343899 RepID=A0A553WAB0_9SPHN|nr:indoleamine 2,3-dioxygenase [Sphingorhabdus contaminans]TSB01611.1 indoleamine 2,3-dioxygenase [Sphingorhabdus contaminans]